MIAEGISRASAYSNRPSRAAPTVIPAQAGIQDGIVLCCGILVKQPTDSRLRGNDGGVMGMTVERRE